MQGLWKEKVGGWNNKDCKRKKQSRKHTLKDKYNIIQKEIFEKKFKELNTNLFYLITEKKYCKNYEKKYCNIIFDDALLEAWTYDEKIWWTESNNKTEILSYDGYYYYENFKKKIKILGVIKYVEPIFYFDYEDNILTYPNQKLIYKNKLLDKYIFSFNKFYYYGSYVETLKEPRNYIKSVLNDYENNQDKILKFKKKQIYLLG